MSSLDVVYEKIHFRHDPRWLRRLGPAAGCWELCVACAIEMMESAEVSVRKTTAGGVILDSDICYLFSLHVVQTNDIYLEVVKFLAS